MAFCLTQQAKDDFKKALKSGAINPETLGGMESTVRREFLGKYVGEANAQQVNSLFESKLLLKNQKSGMITWAKKVSGITADTRRDLISRIQRMDKVLNPSEQQQFLQDLASTRLNLDVTQEEAKRISDLSKIVDEKKTNVTDKKSRIAYGNSILDLYDYTDSLAKKDIGLVGNIVNVANLPRSIMSSLDFSAPFRQGFGMISQPKEFASAFGNMFKYAFSKGAHRDLMADIITRDTYDLMKSSGLRITKLNDKLSQREEAFISSLADRIPGIAASERAYTGFLNKLRADVFDQVIKQAQLEGENVSKSSQVVKDFASVINDFTGSGNIGKNDRYAGAVPLLNGVFFSPRKIASTINVFNPVNYAKLSPPARKFAIKKLVGMLGVSATILSLAALSGAKVETDTNSSDFGKIQIGKTRIDVSGGNANYIVLLSRLISGKTKNSTSEITSNLEGGYGGTTRADVLTRFIRNKLAPVTSFFADFLYGKDSEGKAFDLTNEAKQRVMPLVIKDMIDSVKEDPSNALLSGVLSIFGFGVQSYGSNVDWNQSESKELQQFKNKIGDTNFKQANDLYNQKYNDWLQKTSQTESYKNLSEEGKTTLVTNSRDKIKSDVFKEYGFSYKRESPNANPENSTIKDLAPVLGNPKSFRQLLKEVQEVSTDINIVKKASAKETESSKGATSSLAKNPEARKTGAVYNLARSAIFQAADKYSVDPSLMEDIAYAESKLKPTEKASDNGFDGKTINKKTGEPYPYSSAEGLFQINDATWQDAKKAKVIPDNASKSDAKYNALVAAYFISKGQLKRWNESKSIWGQYHE